MTTRDQRPATTEKVGAAHTLSTAMQAIRGMLDQRDELPIGDAPGRAAAIQRDAVLRALTAEDDEHELDGDATRDYVQCLGDAAELRTIRQAVELHAPTVRIAERRLLGTDPAEAAAIVDGCHVRAARTDRKPVHRIDAVIGCRHLCPSCMTEARNLLDRLEEAERVPTVESTAQGSAQSAPGATLHGRRLLLPPAAVDFDGLSSTAQKLYVVLFRRGTAAPYAPHLWSATRRYGLFTADPEGRGRTFGARKGGVGHAASELEAAGLVRVNHRIGQGRQQRRRESIDGPLAVPRRMPAGVEPGPGIMAAAE